MAGSYFSSASISLTPSSIYAKCVAYSYYDSLLEHPRKVTARIYLLRLHLNLNPSHDQAQPGSNVPHPLFDASQSGPIYFPSAPRSSSNPWTNSPNLIIYVRRLLENGYISHSIFLRAYVSVLVGKSALDTLSFGEVVRTGLGGRGDNGPREQDGGAIARNERELADNNLGEKSPAAWALEMMNRIIPPLTVWVPKQMCSHLMQGLFSVTYSLHTSTYSVLNVPSLHFLSIRHMWDSRRSHLLH